MVRGASGGLCKIILFSQDLSLPFGIVGWVAQISLDLLRRGVGLDEQSEPGIKIISHTNFKADSKYSCIVIQIANMERRTNTCVVNTSEKVAQEQPMLEREAYKRC
jgi:hypothetical protein